MSNNLNTKNILSYNDVANYPAGNSNEPLVDITKYNSTITAKYLKLDMVDITGETIYVRDSVAKKIALIENDLRKKGYGLKVVYGYRHPKIQNKYFRQRRHAIAQQNPKLVGDELDRFTHNFVAVPDIAGHPAGAAVDLTLIDKDGKDIDMGTSIADYTDEEKIKTYANSLTKEQVSNRAMLHNHMIKEGFAPFYGEWWHFSYGDREWAAFYNNKAMYGPTDFTIL